MIHLPGFEWQVAWRHLGRHDRRPPRRSTWVMALGLLLVLLGATSVILANRMGHLRPESMDPGHEALWRTLPLVGLVVANLGAAMLYLRFLLRRFSVFGAISMFGVFLGVAAPIVVLSVMSGFEADLKQKILGEHAHIVVTSPDHAWTEWQRTQARINRASGVAASTPYLEGEVMIATATNNSGIQLRGIDPETAVRVTHLGHSLQVGQVDALAHPERAPPPPDEEPEIEAQPKEPRLGPTVRETPPPGILLGTELAQNLRAYPGSEVTVACLDCGVSPNGLIPHQKRFRVVGLFRTGLYEYDTRIAYVLLSVDQSFLSMSGEITGLEVKTNNLEQSGLIASQLAQELGPGFEVKDWRELNRSLLSALKMEKVAMFIVLGFIVLVASFSIVSNLIMVVVEKAREIAIIKSMGASSPSVVRIFVLEGLYIGMMGLWAGLLAGLSDCLLLGRLHVSLDPEVYYIAKLPVHLDGLELALIGLGAVAISALATAYPAFLAARLRPVEGLRYE